MERELLGSTACVHHRPRRARATPSHAVLGERARARVQGGPLTACGMATRRTQTSGRGRRAWPRDRARGGSQIRVVHPKPATPTRRQDCRAEGSIPTPGRQARCLVSTHRGPRGPMRSAGLVTSDTSSAGLGWYRLPPRCGASCFGRTRLRAARRRLQLNLAPAPRTPTRTGLAARTVPLPQMDARTRSRH